MGSLRNTIMQGLTDQGRIRIRFRKKNEEDSGQARARKEEKNKLRSFQPAEPADFLPGVNNSTFGVEITS
jgi:hypothetical protein